MALVAEQLPRFSAEQAQDLAQKLYGVTGIARQLPSERDNNFHLEDESGAAFVLKIARAGETFEVLDAQNRAMAHVHRHGRAVQCPEVRKTTSGSTMATVPHAGTPSMEHLVRLVTFVPGVPFAGLAEQTPPLLHDLGALLGRLDCAMRDFSHAGARRVLYWDLTEAHTTIGAHLDDIATPGRRDMVSRLADRFAAVTLPRLTSLRRSVIHNDGNDYNVLVTHAESSSPTVSGIIDFGDMIESHTVCNLAVGMAYGILEKPDPVDAGSHIVRGYHRAFPLEPEEIELLFDLMIMRLCLSVSLSAHQQKLNPANTYLTISEGPAWEALHALEQIDVADARAAFHDACNMP
ncbi:MAG: phosphotransferase [Gemmatimonadetes bacterium]|nr:phosphotransferase [Gemmatimonadota bacterium]